jgi:short-subunit dehydrogenase
LPGCVNTEDKNQGVAQELAETENIEVVEIDVTDDKSVTKALEKLLQNMVRPTCWSTMQASPVLVCWKVYSIDQIRNMFEINFYGVLRTYQAVLPGMRKAKKGLIINLTSGASGHTLPFMIPYLASKFVVESITEGLQEELKQFNIEMSQFSRQFTQLR